MIKNTILSFFILLGFFAKSQEISPSEMKKDAIKMAAIFEKENYELSYSKSVYQDKKDQTPVEQTKGVYYFGVSPNYRIEENNLLIVQTKDFTMTIDSTEKKIFISKTASDYSPVNLALYQNDSILNAQKFTKRKENKSFVYTIQSRDVDNGIVELFVSETNFFVYKVNYYLPAGNYVQENLDDESVEQPLVIITYNPVKQKIQNSELFNVNKWLNTAAKPMELQPYAKDFQLIDLRYEPNTSN